MGKPLKLSDHNKSWAKDIVRRQKGSRPQQRYFLIVCEGTKTEPLYFEELKQDLPRGVLEVVIKGEGLNTLGLLDRALEHKEELLRQQARSIDEVWIVFDRDDFPPDDFDNAITSAKSKKVHAGWSNECFELWYVLHFEDRQTPLPRKDCEELLSRYLGVPYKKSDTKMYARLKDKLADAHKRAAKLAKSHTESKHPPHQANPCTQVHKLVEALHRYLPKQAPNKQQRP